MKAVGTLGFVLLLSAGAFAQHRGGAPLAPRGLYTGTGIIPYRTYGSPSGFGNVVFPGTGTPPQVINPFNFGPTFVQRFGSNLNGAPFGFRGRRGGFGGGGYGGGYPLVWPVVVGGVPYEGNGYDPQQQPSNITIVVPPQQGGVSPVTINQNFTPETARPEMSQYPAQGAAPDQSGVQYYQAPSVQPAPASTQDDQVLFFIGLKDSSVYTAVAYWVEDGTLHYVTPQGRHNQVSLDLVDRQVSERLNSGRGVTFKLPSQ